MTLLRENQNPHAWQRFRHPFDNGNEAPRVTFNQLIEWGDGLSVSVSACESPEKALWMAAREMYLGTKRGLLTVKEFRRMLSKRQRRTLSQIACLKITSRWGAGAGVTLH